MTDQIPRRLVENKQPPDRRFRKNARILSEESFGRLGACGWQTFHELVESGSPKKKLQRLVGPFVNR